MKTEASLSSSRVRFPLLAVGTVVAFAAAFFLGRWTAPATVADKTPKTFSVVVAADAGLPAERPGASGTRALDRDAWARRWQELALDSGRPANEAACVTMLRELAVLEPAEAIRLALQETNWRRRGIFLRAALRGWASVTPEAAVAWSAANLREGERRAAVEEIVAGAMTRPAEAIRAIAWLCAADPSMAPDHGNTLIVELARAGEFDAAVDFAAAAPAAWRNHWLGSAFFAWAQHQPERALAALERIPDAATRTEAWQSAVSGWAASDPAALVGYAEHLPAGEARTAALRDGLLQWVTADPVAAVTWMERLDAGAELDNGAAAVATIPELVARRPEVAVTWAKSIADTVRRSSTLADVLRQWAASDPAAARRYAESSADLRPGDRVSFLDDLNGSAP